MAVEMERRFLVLGMSKGILEKSKTWGIKQGYFDLTFPPYLSFRIRLITKPLRYPLARRRAVLGFKEGSGMLREENEERVSLETAQFLFLCH